MARDGSVRPMAKRSRDAIDDFLAGAPHAVVGVSKDRAKYGNKVLRCYLQNERPVLAVHPRETEVEGVACVSSIAELPDDVHGLSIVTPPTVTEQVVLDAAKKGIRRLWMQPGAESAKALASARELGIEVIAGGPCLLVALGFRE
jgi:uncharacterized protein